VSASTPHNSKARKRYGLSPWILCRLTSRRGSEKMAPDGREGQGSVFTDGHWREVIWRTPRAKHRNWQDRAPLWPQRLRASYVGPRLMDYAVEQGCCLSAGNRERPPLGSIFTARCGAGASGTTGQMGRKNGSVNRLLINTNFTLGNSRFCHF